MTRPPLRFAFGLHLHQPIGNFDSVFEAHVREVYRPLLDALVQRGCCPFTLHLSGPLFEWLEEHEPAWLDTIGLWVADGRVELLCSGWYEPILAALPAEDRREQIRWMRDALRRRFGMEPTGLWLTERVWEPDLPADLADVGIRYVLVDDRHFLISGFPRERLHAPFRTEHDGRRLVLFPIDEHLRYLIPFRPPAETVAYLRGLREAGHPLAILADDGEKFGGWPGTREWVWEGGWLDRFLGVMHDLVAAGEIRLVTLSQALEEVPSAGLAYLPTASYREMETWALPAAAATRLAALERELGAERLAGPDGALLRGGHWRHFLVKYPEANRMHKKMLALSSLCRRRGDPPVARRAIGRAQCNDAYWHGVFGGIYLPHLRRAVWACLAAAERELRRGEPPSIERLDLDGDGHDELWVHSARGSALVSPARGGTIEELTVFETGVNYADVLTRRREAYYDLAAPVDPAPEPPVSAGMPSIHELERSTHLDRVVPVDVDDRALFVERVLPTALSREAYARGDYTPVRSWAREPFAAQIAQSPAGVDVALRAPGLEKRYRFDAAGGVVVEFRWEPDARPGDRVFTTELSLGHPTEIRCTPDAEIWESDIVTVSKSERGLEDTVQGRSVTVRWPAAGGVGKIELTGKPPSLSD